MVAGLVVESTAAFSLDERIALYRAIAARRDVRKGFLDVPLPDELLMRILQAAHCAPSVGLMQPSRFILVRSRTKRETIHSIFTKANAQASADYDGEQRLQYDSLKLEGILEAPQSLCVVCDVQSERGHRLGRHTMPETALYSTICAIQNFWLAARAEGVGVGWVSILDPEQLREVLNIPPHLVLVAYLCLGYVDSFGTIPELERNGWEARISLDDILSYETYNDSNPS
jgi:5,6-dimethylbenzimidazole synthase